MQANISFKIKWCVVFACFWGLLVTALYAQENQLINPILLNNTWDAEWISYPGISLHDYGVYHFRKTFKLEKKPKKYIIHLSGDNRYKLYINGEEVCNGPARGDLMNWRFETVDISAYLKTGDNIIAAVVWNFGEYAPLAQISNKTAFIVQGDTEIETEVNTSSSWRVYRNRAYLYPEGKSKVTVVGPGDKVVASKYPYGWESLNYDDSNWEVPVSLGRGSPYGKSEGRAWLLIPRNIPMMEHKFQRINEVERTEGVVVTNKFLTGQSPVNIPAHTTVKLLFDQTYLTTAYPELEVSGGKNAEIVIRYAEALIDTNGNKGNRNNIAGKNLLSDNPDIFKPDGEPNRHFKTLWFRTYRYIELTIKTADEPLFLNDLYGWFTAYPLKQLATFNSDDPTLKEIWDTGWRTARLCAGETYFDCPYYEQLQYIGDTRIQALISLYVSGDDRLMRNAIQQFNNSALPIGLTQSRYPTSETQIIPPFSLSWIAMIHDYWMLREDEPFINEQLNGIRNVLSWYQQQIAANGILGGMDWWNFVDWPFGPWNPIKQIGGVPHGAIEGGSSILTLQYAYALQMAAELFNAHGRHTEAANYQKLASALTIKTKTLCWNKSRGLLADDFKQTNYSQHANILAVLTGMFPQPKEKILIKKIFHEPALTEATLYFKFYLVQAMKKAGLADGYINQLKPWKEMISMGLTTFAETPDPTRSDCHAWSASPNYDLLATVCGITPGSSGFRTVKIEPHFGPLNMLGASLPHPKGTVKISLQKRGKFITGEIVLPAGVPGEIIWCRKKVTLHPGKQLIKL